ncbi:MAG: CBS domain-containing protein [Acidobacteria bacterium]|nr:CBS domain-containing protein [Acidobacteriota bacterium]
MATVPSGVDRILYLTELTGMSVFAPNGQRVGRVWEVALKPSEHPTRVSHFLVGRRSHFMVRYDEVESISLEGIRLSDDRFVPYYPDENLLLLSKDLLDQQIVDVNGRKVVRVNDLALRIEHVAARDELWVHEVGVGLQGAFRRLMEGILPNRLIRQVQRKITPNSIPWQYCNIVEPDARRRLRLRISHDRLGKLHPADLADIVEELGPAEREALFETLDDTVAAETLTEVDSKIQISILNSLDKSRAADIVEEMEPDQAADILERLEEAMSRGILKDMEQAPAAEVEELLEYEGDTAGGLMNSQYAAVNEDARVRDAIEALRGSEHLLKSLTHVFLIDKQQRLVASVAVGRLLTAPNDAPLKELAFEETLKVHVDEDRDRVVEIFDKYNLFALPVVNEDNELCGVITADDVISVLTPDD